MDEDNAYMRHLKQVYTGAPVLSISTACISTASYFSGGEGMIEWLLNYTETSIRHEK
jgi:hypothetical protein